MLNQVVDQLLISLDTLGKNGSSVIPWSCPIPVFGALQSRIATLGLNPSNKEFMDDAGKELTGTLRRFSTLGSLYLDSWGEADTSHISSIIEDCEQYFARNPYNGWFGRLENIFSGTNYSYYSNSQSACHLDLIPFATHAKWSTLGQNERTELQKDSAQLLAKLISDSDIQMLVLNGASVVSAFQTLAGCDFDVSIMKAWTLPRRTTKPVTGVEYLARVSSINRISINREIMVWGFNHNLQSSFGVTRAVTSAIRARFEQVTQEAAL